MAQLSGKQSRQHAEELSADVDAAVLAQSEVEKGGKMT
jgi:hypothetical protein